MPLWMGCKHETGALVDFRQGMCHQVAQAGELSDLMQVHQIKNLPTDADDGADSLNTIDSLSNAKQHALIKGALLATRFSNLDELKSVVAIQYTHVVTSSVNIGKGTPVVLVTHCSSGKQVTSVLRSGVSEKNFKEALEGNFWDKIALGFRSPYTLINRKKLLRVSILARRRHDIFGWRDVAFYDLAEAMVHHIHGDDLQRIDPKDLGEKGYINTFNHINAEAIMTTLFSEGVADFIADAHERFHMPELIDGVFSDEQLKDPNNNPMDNYVDIVNNEWGQELGKELKKKYGIQSNTEWTEQLLVNYLNDLQSYFAWAFQIGFEPFEVDDYEVIRFTRKLNETRSN